MVMPEFELLRCFNAWLRPSATAPTIGPPVCRNCDIDRGHGQKRRRYRKASAAKGLR
jgi:hypothetical protein